MNQENLPTPNIDWLFQQTHLICRSYHHWTGRVLCDLSGLAPEAAVTKLFELPQIVLSAGQGSDPLLNFGNKAALKLWEMTWEQLTQTPGSRTAEAPEREERSRFLKEVSEKGFVSNYQGVRISKTGRRFRIRNAVVWNLVDSDGSYHGQAATFSDWDYL